MVSCLLVMFPEQSLTRVACTQVRENRKLAWSTWVRRAAADACVLRRSAPTWSSAMDLYET